MGTVCSLWKKNSAIDSSDNLGKSVKSGPNTTTQYSLSSSIVLNAIWNPFRISREEAENLLQDSYSGAFLFSHSITAEIFLSMSTGKYVCHHPVFKHAQKFEVGGRIFNNIEEAVLFYRLNPLGDAILTEQYNSLHELEQMESKHSHNLNNSGNVTKSKPKRVTFQTPKEVLKAELRNTQPVAIRNDSLGKRQTTLDDELSSEKNEQLFKKIINRSRKSICRVQPEDSLSTSSEHMFKEEDF